MRIAFRLVAASIALSAAAVAQEPSSAPRPDLARHLEALNRIEERNPDRSFAVTDEHLALIAREIEQAIHIPPTWHVLLRQDDEFQFGADAIHTLFTPQNELLTTTLSDRVNRKLELVLTLDAQWVLLGRAATFIGIDGTTEFNRRQFRNRTDYFPLSAIPVVLDRLESELDALPLAQSGVRELTLQWAQPSGQSPSIRCVLDLEDKSSDPRWAIDLNGLVPLPPAAAHGKEFEFVGRRGDDIGPVKTNRTLRQVYREAQALCETIQSAGEWYAHAFHDSGLSSFPTHVIDARNRPAARYQADFRIDSAGFVGTTDELAASIAGVPLTAYGVRRFLKCVVAAYDTRKQFVFLVLGCADQHELLVFFTSAGARTPAASDLTCLRLVFEVDGSRVDRMEPLRVHDVRRATEGRHTRWTCRFGDDRVADVSVHTLIGCTTGDDVTSRARVGDTDYRVAGGFVETALRHD